MTVLRLSSFVKGKEKRKKKERKQWSDKNLLNLHHSMTRRQLASQNNGCIILKRRAVEYWCLIYWRYRVGCIACCSLCSTLEPCAVMTMWVILFVWHAWAAINEEVKTAKEKKKRKEPKRFRSYDDEMPWGSRKRWVAHQPNYFCSGSQLEST